MTTILDKMFLRPLATTQIFRISAALTVAATVYCLAYTAFAGRMATLEEAFVWPVLNILPWFVCFEVAKRQVGWSKKITLILLVLVGMAIVDSVISHDLSLSAGTVLFEMTRRVPGAALVVALLTLSEITKHFALTTTPASSPLLEPVDLPLLASQISWISAAGNYVELHGVEKPVLHRAPISVVERTLADHGFVRVHRSVLVSRHAIESIAKGLVTLKCGQTIKIGNRYRSALDQIR